MASSTGLNWASVNRSNSSGPYLLSQADGPRLFQTFTFLLLEWHGILFSLCVMGLEIIFPHHTNSMVFLVECRFSFFRTDLFLVDNTQDLQTFALWKRKTKRLTTWHLLVLPWCECLHEIRLSAAFYFTPVVAALYAVEFSRRDSWVLSHSQWKTKFLVISWLWKKVSCSLPSHRSMSAFHL